jgi:hypothetical protein
MFFIDDMLLRSLGINLPGLDMIWTIEQIQKFAYKGLYDPVKIKNQIKETRMLYEFGELDRKEYEQKNSDLMDKLDMAEKFEEMNLNSKVDILG